MLTLYFFKAIYANKNRQVIVMRIWGGLTLLTSLIDLMMTMLMAMDYTTCRGTSSEIISQAQYSCYLAVGIVMTIVARGFTLWLINVILAIILITMLRNETNVSKY